MVKICLTGGPGGGKSSCRDFLTDELEKRGYKVLFLPESATNVLNMGIRPGINVSVHDFQDMVIDDQLQQEAIADKYIRRYGGKNTVILCDRGLLDQMAYLERPEFSDMLAERNMTEEEGIRRYDRVIHLVTTADGARESYHWNDGSTGNTAVRWEKPDEAVRMDERTWAAWEKHPEHYRVESTGSFSEKAGKVLKLILQAIDQKNNRQAETGERL